MVFWTNLSLVVRQTAVRLTWLYVPCIQSRPEMRGNLTTQVALHDRSGRLLQLTVCPGESYKNVDRSPGGANFPSARRCNNHFEHCPAPLIVFDRRGLLPGLISAR